MKTAKELSSIAKRAVATRRRNQLALKQKRHNAAVKAWQTRRISN